MVENNSLHCSFCGKSASEVKKLISGPDIYICDECVDTCHNVLSKERKSTSKQLTHEKPKETPSPREIKEYLDIHVIGQEKTKETLAVAVYNHYKRINNPIIDGVEIDKSNILLFGPTGSGKTYMVQSLAKMLNVPYAVTDATSLTQPGYVGEDVETILSRLLANTKNNDIKDAERGIVFIDEIDKKATKIPNGSSPDVGGEGVQQALLKILEGSEVMVPVNGNKRSPNAEIVKFNTKNILFILGGAFVGLDKIVQQSEEIESSSIGFGSKIKNSKHQIYELLQKVQPEHLVSYGLMPELVGRLPIMSALEELDEEKLVKVLVEPKNSLVKQYQAMFKLEGIELIFDEKSLYAVAKQAYKRKTGARSLRGILESKLQSIQFNLPDLKKEGVKKIVISSDTIEKNAYPKTF